METTLTEVQVESIKIYEEPEAIRQLDELAASNVLLLQQLHQLAPELKSEELILSAAGNPKKYVMDIFFSTNKEAKKMAAYSKIEFYIGHDLETLQRLLTGVTARCFKFTKWDRKENTFTIDQQDLEQSYRRFQKFAETPQQVARWKFAQHYVDFIRNEMRAGEFAQRKFAGEIMTFNARVGFVPDWRFVHGDYKH